MIPDLGPFGQIESRTCFLPMITADSAELLRLSGHWEKGTLPFRGGLYDQPAVLEHAMATIRDQQARIAAQKAAAARRRGAR